jgi:hypothetical protein
MDIYFFIAPCDPRTKILSKCLGYMQEHTTGHYARRTSIATCFSAWIEVFSFDWALAKALILKQGLKPKS